MNINILIPLVNMFTFIPKNMTNYFIKSPYSQFTSLKKYRLKSFVPYPLKKSKIRTDLDLFMLYGTIFQ